MCFFEFRLFDIRDRFYNSGPILILISMSFFFIIICSNPPYFVEKNRFSIRFDLIKTAIFTILSGFIAGFSVEIQGFERVQNR